MRMLWAPWRLAYLERSRHDDKNLCVFCAARDGSDREALILGRTKHSLIRLNRFPSSFGHVLVVPLSHVDEPSRLDVQEYQDLMQSVRQTTTLLRDELAAHGMNVGLNLGRAAGASIPDHFHWHVIPRWEGDFNFLPVTADIRVMPELLDQTYDRLVPRFQALG